MNWALTFSTFANMPDLIDWLKYLFSTPEPVYLIHPFFGNLEEEDGTLLGKRMFTPLQRDVELLIEKGDDPTLNNQEGFYHWLEAHYQDVYVAIEHYFETDSRTEDLPVDGAEFVRGIELETIHIPAAEFSTDTPWQITYYEDRYAHHWFTMEMNGARVTGFCMDG